MNPNARSLPIYGIIVAALLLIFFTPPSIALTSNECRIVKRVIDGDTLLLDQKERVRLIGVDTPETKHPQKPVERFGKEAAAFTRKMVEGKRVRLEFDQANVVRGHKDRYGRTLALRLPGGWQVAQCGDHSPGLRIRLHAVSVCEDGGVPATGAGSARATAGALGVTLIGGGLNRRAGAVKILRRQGLSNFFVS